MTKHVTSTSMLIPTDLAIALASRQFFTGNLTGAQEFGSSAACTGFDGPDAGTAADGNVCAPQSGANRPFTINRRFLETGPRVGIFDSKTALIRGTLSGPLAHGFNWDVTASYGRADQVATLLGNINVTAVRNGLDGCPAGSLPGCVPLDIFGPGTVVGDQLAFVNLDTKETRAFDQARIAGNVTGNLFELPAGPVGVAVGVEARTDRGAVKVDDAQRTGNIYGFNATQDERGKVNVKEVYGEVRVPILADTPGFHDLSVEAGARYSDYSSVGGLFNYKLGAQWAPVEWLKFRGIYNKAARAPSITELFLNGNQGFVTVNDFCGGLSVTPAVIALCQAQVVQAGGPAGFDFTGFAQNNSQLQAFAFGNPDLQEETAKTYTVGAVLTPNLGLGRFSATVDYYNIRIDDFVTGLGAGFFLSQCAGGLDPFSAACLRIARNPVTGQVDGISTTISNQGTLKTAGVDGSINFVVPFSDLGIGLPGRFRFQELISWLDKYDFNGTRFEGTTGGGIGGSISEWKSTMTVAYDSPSFTAQLRWNWQSDLDDISFSSTSQVGENQTAPEVGGLSYFDLSLRKKIGSNFELTGNIQNLFNAKAKRTVAGFGGEGGTDVAYYNPVILGRYFTISGKVKL